MATTPVSSASVYGDFAGLEKLKTSARGNDPAAVRQVAQQLEGLFARMMIKSMREAIGKDPIFGSDQAQTYQGMYDDQLSLELTRGKGLGLTDMLMRQLQGSATHGTTGGGAPGAPTGTKSGAPTPAGSSAPVTPTQRASFISQIWPEASRCAQQLGVPPLGLIAQAALESNWGQSTPRTPGGDSSNNLFGIKTGSGWTGPSASARTQEFADGAAHTVSASFRAYASPGESFKDYAALLSGNARFSAALGSGSSVPAFAGALQRAGFATDPDYARKVTAVAGEVAATLARGIPQPAGEPLKFADAAPIASMSRQTLGES